MTRRRLLLALGFALAVLVALAISSGMFTRFHQPPRFTQEQADHIPPGMTEADVVAFMGRPAGNYASPGVCFADACTDYKSDVWASPGGRHRPDGTTEKAWLSDQGGVAVVFSAEGRVVYAYFEEMWAPEPPSFYGQVLDWFRSLWR